MELPTTKLKYINILLALLLIIAVVYSISLLLFITTGALIIINLKSRIKQIEMLSEVRIFKEKDVVYLWDGREHEFIEKTSPEKGLIVLAIKEDHYLCQSVIGSRTEKIYFPNQYMYWRADELRHLSKASAEGFSYQRNYDD